MTRLDHTSQSSRFLLIGFIFACLYALTKIHTPSGISNAVGAPMVLLGLYSIYRYGKGLSVKIPMLLLLVSIIIPLISWYFAHDSYPELTDDSPRLGKMARIFLFIPLAWWLKDSPKKVFIFLGLASLPILFSPWISGGSWQEIAIGWSGSKRIDFGLRNHPEHASLFFGFVLVGLVCFAPRIFRYSKYLFALLVPAIMFCAFTIIATQTRASWVALIGAISICLLYFICTGLKKEYLQPRYLLVFTLVLLTSCLVVFKSMGHIVEKRSGAESGVIEHILSGDIENVPYTSIGIRIHMWRASFAKIEERPLTGWGNNGQSIAIDQTAWMPDHIKHDFGHIHNIYIALLTNYGLFGLIFYLVWVGWLLTKVLKAVSKNLLNRDIGYFSIATISFWSVTSIFESYLFFWTGVLCLQITFAAILALIWQAEIKEKQQQDNQTPQ
ncbi:O-antigen ligase family protein [Marinomonas pollencensis]|uniref:O-antigen ligase n=1 Tax=Marinomonas pollencensis TaxID=491954 RepID=A0A3E0DA11_9GAMM|nr:O-antigen ligase family protein [Marinomonas pollencensis]REG79516.1 O-antigen ligase [Marinomonas pollencensis]